jgi:tRNA threonylcarbamoyladenosine biosynthesis protein TsaE
LKPSTTKASFPFNPASLVSASPEETARAGEALGAALEPGDIVALEAPLGAGKTVFAKGIARALGVAETVRSPTYTIISEYDSPRGVFYHIDAYRLSGEDEFRDTGGEEALFSGGICVIEWSERVGGLLPPEAVRVSIRLCGGSTREISVSVGRSS